MAATSTHASARTHTKTRLDTLLHQVEQTMRRTAGADDHRIELLELGFRERWIQQISVYALDPKRYGLARLRIEVDWATHDQKNQESPEFTVESEDGLTINTKSFTNSFLRFVAGHASQVADTYWQVRYTDEVYADPELLRKVDRKLKLKPCDRVVWRDGQRDTLDYRHDDDDEEEDPIELAELSWQFQYCVSV